jgi:hypothetical protein
VTYLGQMAAGQAIPASWAKPGAGGIMLLPGGPYGDVETKRATCASFIQYLDANDLDALSAAIQGLSHNNATYLEQYAMLNEGDREALNECAHLAASEMLSDAWGELTPEQQTAHNKWIREQLAEETAGRPGIGVVCPPGTPPAACLEKIHAAVDQAECKGGVLIPLGPVKGCIPRGVVIGAVIAVAALVFVALRGR